MVAPTKFGALLASNDKETRDQALKAVTRFLKRSHDIDELELSKVHLLLRMRMPSHARTVSRPTALLESGA